MIRPARDARLRAGLSAQAAALKLGITPGHLRDLERGDALWSFHRAEKAARLYGCDFQTFIRPNRGSVRGAEARNGGSARGTAGPLQGDA